MGRIQYLLSDRVRGDEDDTPPGDNCFENTLGLLGLRRERVSQFSFNALKNSAKIIIFCWWWMEVSVGGTKNPFL